MIPNAEKAAADPLLDEIRAIKQSISARFDHDVAKLCEHLRREQEASCRRMVRRRSRVDEAHPAK